MKKAWILLVLFAAAFPVFAQRPALTAVGIPLFAVPDGSVSAEDAREATRLVRGELGSWGTLDILPEEQEGKAAYLVRGRVSLEDGRFVLGADTVEVSSGRVLNASRVEAASLDSMDIAAFCSQAAENIPYPDYLLGRWRSSINTVDGPVTCVLEFRTGRRVLVERFDTWEHNGVNSLKYQAIGSGTYSYAGYLRRTVTIGGRQIEADATASVNLRLEDALPKYAAVSSGTMRLLFNGSKTAFAAVSGGIPCGDNFSGAAVYPSARVYYTEFTKIQ